MSMASDRETKLGQRVHIDVCILHAKDGRALLKSLCQPFDHSLLFNPGNALHLNDKVVSKCLRKLCVKQNLGL